MRSSYCISNVVIWLTPFSLCALRDHSLTRTPYPIYPLVSFFVSAADRSKDNAKMGVEVVIIKQKIYPHRCSCVKMVFSSMLVLRLVTLMKKIIINFFLIFLSMVLIKIQQYLLTCGSSCSVISTHFAKFEIQFSTLLFLTLCLFHFSAVEK